MKPTSRNNGHLRSDDGQTDRHTDSKSTYRLGPSGRMGRVKRNRGIQETDYDLFIERKKTFENIHVSTSFIVQIPLDAIWPRTFRILMKWLQPGLCMILDCLFFFVSCCRLQWLTWIFLLVFKLVKLRRCDIQKLALSVFSFASSMNPYISI